MLNRSEFNKTITELINDKKKIRKLTHKLTAKQEQALQRTLRKLNKKNIFSESEYSDSNSKDSKIATLYDIQYIHNYF